MNIMKEDNLITRAIIGTGQSAVGIGETGATGTPASQLLASIEVNEERKLLLTAGTSAIYQRAGRVSLSNLSVPASAPTDTLSVCSSNITPLLQELLRRPYNDESKWLLTEAVKIMQQCQLVLPPELLPLALTHYTYVFTSSVLGERGRWLCQFNERWSETQHSFEESAEAVPADAETIWQEGSLSERASILRRVRAVRPAQGREWLMEVWKQEKADVRESLINALEVGLSIDDEPFLEKMLDDRASYVREEAVSLLSQLPISAYVERMRTLANTLLTIVSGKLVLTLPDHIDKAWKRDGIDERSPISDQLGTGASVAAQVLTSIPLTHWEERFQRTPDELVRMAQASEWGDLLLKSWSYAARIHGGERWLAPLWQWWHTADEALQNATIRGTKLTEIYAALATSIPNVVEELVLRMPFGTERWLRALSSLPTPWSDTLSERYVREQHETILSYATGKTAKNSYAIGNTISRFWIPSLSVAARGLSPASFNAALADEAIFNREDIQPPAYPFRQSYQEEYAQFTEILRIRKRFLEEMKAS